MVVVAVNFIFCVWLSASQVLLLGLCGHWSNKQLIPNYAHHTGALIFFPSFYGYRFLLRETICIDFIYIPHTSSKVFTEVAQLVFCQRQDQPNLVMQSVEYMYTCRCDFRKWECCVCI